MSDPRWVTAHGKQILIETLDLPGTQPPKAKRGEARVMLSLQWAADAAKAAKTPRTMVLILLSYAAWRSKSLTFPLPNTMLARYGVSREIKRRVLAQLESAGRIKVKKRANQAPIVTLLVRPNPNVDTEPEC